MPSVAGSRSIRKEGGDALPPGDDSQSKEILLTVHSLVRQQCCLALPSDPIFGLPTLDNGRHRKNDPDSDWVKELRRPIAHRVITLAMGSTEAASPSSTISAWETCARTFSMRASPSDSTSAPSSLPVAG